MSTPNKEAALSSPLRTFVGYGLMIGGTVLAYSFVRSAGERRLAPGAAAGQALFGAQGGSANADVLAHVLLALVVVIITARAVGSLFRWLAQPPVVGEILAGILLGPSLLGRVAPAVSAYILPKTVAPFLGILSQVGVILYMFLVGLELDPGLL